MKWLGLFLFPPGWDASPSQGYPSIKFARTHLYTWVKRGTVRVKCLAQEHNTMTPARARTKTTQIRVKYTDHEATTPSDAWHNVIEMYAQEKHRHKMNATPLYCTSICTDPQFLRSFTVHILFYKFCSTITQNHCMLFTIEGVQEKDPQWHPIDCKILLANSFSLPCTEKENLTWDQESLRAFFHAPL